MGETSVKFLEHFVRTTSDFSARLLTDYDVNEVLEELAERQTELLDLLGSGVSLARGDRLEAVTAVPHLIVPLEKQQELDQSGPCLEAFRTGRIESIDDLASEDRWPTYLRIARDQGIRAVAAVPMRLNDQPIGALNLYCGRPRAWSEQDLSAALALANMATAFIINASSLAKQTLLAEQLQQALDTRVLLEQAKGVLAEAHAISVEEAFRSIRRFARARRVSLHEVANAVVHMGVRLT
ncbi:GAF and ANTAR domain-containing protein [Litorihabitans aurantiacus]|nr:GAF and ANTAR domain-containing protein [Litorihabitans aurantiacus]